jgi:hypothetical protein
METEQLGNCLVRIRNERSWLRPQSFQGIEFDIGLLEQEIQLRFKPGHCRDATLKAVEPNPNCEK